MNLLIDSLPEAVSINGAEYAIRSDFRTGIRFELLIQDDEKPEAEKLLESLLLFYPEIPDDIHGAVDRMLWFYRCGKEDEDQKAEEAKEEAPDSDLKADYSFKHDAAYIYAAFLEAYGIDLTKTELHWWTFRALFLGLPEECAFQKIRGYRSLKISSKMSKEQKEFYRKMKRLFALPISKKEQAAHDRITEALMNGGDLSGIL